MITGLLELLLQSRWNPLLACQQLEFIRTEMLIDRPHICS
jgi:hypothetical protein